GLYGTDAAAVAGGFVPPVTDGLAGLVAFPLADGCTDDPGDVPAAGALPALLTPFAAGGAAAALSALAAAAADFGVGAVGCGAHATALAAFADAPAAALFAATGEAAAACALSGRAALRKLTKASINASRSTP
ncbi:hypothetical protein JNB70_25440, partial [Rhizobium pusense]|uniref:hypothetical protein n=1 Tax=Agrobacterium pusense TaxID=648995 RepID=UPI001C6E2A84